MQLSYILTSPAVQLSKNETRNLASTLHFHFHQNPFCFCHARADARLGISRKNPLHVHRFSQNSRYEATAAALAVHSHLSTVHSHLVQKMMLTTRRPTMMLAAGGGGDLSSVRAHDMLCLYEPTLVICNINREISNATTTVVAAAAAGFLLFAKETASAHY